MIDIEFNGATGQQMNVGVKSVDRTFLPERDIHFTEITGKSGAYATDWDTYRQRTVSVEIFIKANDFNELRLKIRELAKWLSGPGLLKFSDEPDKYYKAYVKDFVPLKQREQVPQALIEIDFICEPFAESLLKQETFKNEINLTYKGNVKSYPILIIKGKGQITITRKVKRRS